MYSLSRVYSVGAYCVRITETGTKYNLTTERNTKEYVECFPTLAAFIVWMMYDSGTKQVIDSEHILEGQLN